MVEEGDTSAYKAAGIGHGKLFPSARYVQKRVDVDSESQKSMLPHERYLQDPTTGGFLSLCDAFDAFCYFVSQLSECQDSFNLFAYRIKEDAQHDLQHVCSIALAGSVVDGIEGTSRMSFAVARQEACFWACNALARLGYLDSRYYTRYVKSIAHLRNHSFSTSQHLYDKGKLPAMSLKFAGTRCYRSRAPHFWSFSAISVVQPLFPVVISLNFADGASYQPFAPIVLLTRLALPLLPSFRIFFSGEPAMVSFQRASLIGINAEKFSILFKYTLRVMRAITNRPLKCAVQDMPYFVAALPVDWEVGRARSRHHYPEIICPDLPWDVMSQAVEKWAIPLQAQSLEGLLMDTADSLIVDRYSEFTRRYTLKTVRGDLTPLSAPGPTDVNFSPHLALIEFSLIFSGKPVLKASWNISRRIEEHSRVSITSSNRCLKLKR
jgi:endoribonuclease Dicer